MNETKRVIALGFFDGVHNGHAALMRRTVQVAQEIGATPSAFTFDPHPQTVILGKPMPLITSPEDRGDLMRKYYGIQDVIVEPFTPQFMKQHWRKFLEETLIQPDQTQITLCLTGSGAVEYKMYIDGEFYRSMIWNFNANG